jgi:hypothetical protein
LHFGFEGGLLLSQNRNEWLRQSPQPGAYSASAISQWRDDLNRPTQADSPETFANKFQAIVALERLGLLAGLGDQAQTRQKLNEALLDCFRHGSTGLKTEILDYFTPARIALFEKKDLDALRDHIQALFVSYSGTLGTALPDDRLAVSFEAFLSSCCDRLPDLYKDVPPKQRSEIESYLKNLLVKEANSIVDYPANFPGLRFAALDALMRLNQAEACICLESVLRHDELPALRLKALDKLQELSSPNLRQLCIELLSKEQDPVILDRLRTVEYFERRPDRASEKFQKELRQACETLSRKYPYELSDSAEYQRMPAQVKGADGRLEPSQKSLDAVAARTTYNERYTKGWTQCNIPRKN